MEKNRSEYFGPIEDFRFGREVQNIAKHFRRLGDENLQKEGLTISQLRVISYVSRNGERGTVYQKDLEEHFQIRRSSVTSLLQNLEKSGLLVRYGSPTDARVKTVALTEKGVRLDEQLKSYIHTLEEALMQGFDPKEKECFRSYLFRLLENLESIERSRV